MSPILQRFSMFLAIYIINIGRSVARKLLFKGKINDKLRNKEFFKEMIDRYKVSIDEVNKKIGLSFTFTIIALYAYFVLPNTEAISIPIVEVSVSRQIWVSISPAIFLSLQVLVVVSFVWFMVVKVAIKILVEESKINTPHFESMTENYFDKPEKETQEIFIDTTNILLRGILGDIWMIFSINKVFKSWINYLWYVPLLLLTIFIIASPMILSIFFVYQLFLAQLTNLGIIYTVISIPITILSIILIGLLGTLGIHF